jgi:hypothetical protein
MLSVYTDFLWMDSVGQSAVFTKLLWTKIALGLIVGGVFFAWLWINLRLARRAKPAEVAFIGRRLLPDEDRAQIEVYADRALFIFCLIGAVFAGFYAAAQAVPLLVFLNSVPFGKTDPIFGNDLGFYVFRLPFWFYLYRSAMYMAGFAFVVALLVHLYQENVRLVGNTIHADSRARRHLFGLLGIVLLIKIAGYRLAQFSLLNSTTGKLFSGASYADVAARLPVLWGMMLLALVAAVLTFMSIKRRDFKLVGWPLALLLVVSFLGGTVYPQALQRLVVVPNQLEKEQPFLQRNIAATRDAFGLSQVARSNFQVSGTLDAETLRANRQTLTSIRLWDYRPLEATFDMLQTLRPYYSFPGVDVDRYDVNGALRQVSIAPRQLDYNKLSGQAWQNQHLIYTHGYGAVVSPVNEGDGRGLPVFWVSGLPPKSTVPQMDIKQPSVYYQSSSLPPLIELVSSPEAATQPSAEQAPGGPGAGPGGAAPATPAPTVRGPLSKAPAGEVPYVLVNTKQPELDYPSLATSAAAAPTADQNQMVNYGGKGGVQLSSFIRRLAFAARFSDLQILLTAYLKPDSRIQLHRYLPESLSAVAPFMMYDPDPYMVIADGRLVWICDAYTVSDRYPYSTLASNVATDSVNLPSINYLRNSVKVTVDAYDGLPTFHIVDPQDPVVQCYQKIFPTLFTQQEMSPIIRRHLRVPLLQFLTQAKVYGLYHIEDPTTFFNREDMWAVPPEIFGTTSRPTEPYYVVMKLPGAEKEQFLLMLPYVLKGREERVAVAWMAAICDEPDYGKLVVYDFPKSPGVMGPMQFEGLIDQNTDISQAFSLWNQAGSRVVRGNTLMIPVDGSMLYVEPVYLVATEKNAVPQLQRVIVAYGEQIVMEPTLDAALQRLFGVDLKLAQTGPAKITVPASGAGVTAIPAPVPGQPATAGPPPTVPSAGTGPSADLRGLIDQALVIDTQAQTALRQGDLATYQQKQKQVGDLLRQMQQQAR